MAMAVHWLHGKTVQEAHEQRRQHEQHASHSSERRANERTTTSMSTQPRARRGHRGGCAVWSTNLVQPHGLHTLYVHNEKIGACSTPIEKQRSAPHTRQVPTRLNLCACTAYTAQ